MSWLLLLLLLVLLLDNPKEEKEDKPLITHSEFFENEDEEVK